LRQGKEVRQGKDVRQGKNHYITEVRRELDVHFSAYDYVRSHTGGSAL